MYLNFFIENKSSNYNYYHKLTKVMCTMYYMVQKNPQKLFQSCYVHITMYSTSFHKTHIGYKLVFFLNINLHLKTNITNCIFFEMTKHPKMLKNV